MHVNVGLVRDEEDGAQNLMGPSCQTELKKSLAVIFPGSAFVSVDFCCRDIDDWCSDPSAGDATVADGVMTLYCCSCFGSQD